MRASQAFALVVMVLPFAVPFAACSSSDAAAAGSDAGSEYTIPSGCVPGPDGMGNSKRVGSYCTVGGAQCSANGSGNATVCAIDVDPKGKGFCILIGCHSHADCGENACCTGREGLSIHACIPLPCLSTTDECPPIPGAGDGGDAGEGGDADGDGAADAGPGD